RRQFYHAAEARPIPAPPLGSPFLPDLRSASAQSAQAGAARLADREPADRRPGARAPRARERRPLERSFGQSAARMAAPGPRRLLRRDRYRHHPRGLLLPGNRRIGRSPAAARMRSALASAPARATSRDPAHAARGKLRAGILSRCATEEDARGYGARARRISA